MRPLVFAACLACTCTLAAQDPTSADRLIGGHLPVWNAELTADIAVQIAKLAKVPLGIEAFPRNPSARLLAPDERRQLAGRTVRDALDWLMDLDPRYRWIEIGGVIVIRPAAAWDDAQHFVNRTPDEVLPGLNRMFRDAGYEPVDDASLFETLNDAARAGLLVWEVDHGRRVRGKSSLWLYHAHNRQGGSVELPFPPPAWLTDDPAASATMARGAQEAAADRVIDGPLTHTRNYLNGVVIAQIARYARVPVGFEAVPDHPYETEFTTLPMERQKVLTGLTVREALDWLVELDPRYYWVESRGVIVVRPFLAWGDDKHFLNRIVDDVRLEERDPADLVSGLSNFFQFGTFTMPLVPSPVWIPLTLSVRHRSVLDVLNEAARVGDLQWTITYREPPVPHAGPVRLQVMSPDRRGHAIYPRVPLPRWLSELTLR